MYHILCGFCLLQIYSDSQEIIIICKRKYIISCFTISEDREEETFTNIYFPKVYHQTVSGPCIKQI